MGGLVCGYHCEEKDVEVMGPTSVKYVRERGAWIRLRTLSHLN
jgi:hypothetical protein